MRRNLTILASVTMIVTIFVIVYLLITPEDVRDNMGMDGLPQGVVHLPAVMGYADGEEVYFAHPEASAPDVAAMLTEMMDGSPVLVVPGLADVPQSALAIVYVFANGIEGDGPLGFQADVFDHPPGSHGYSPLRVLHRVTWNTGAEPRRLTSATEVVAALTVGELSIEETGIVVNMPFLSWPGGQR